MGVAVVPLPQGEGQGPQVDPPHGSEDVVDNQAVDLDDNEAMDDLDQGEENSDSGVPPHEGHSGDVAVQA